MDRGRRRAALLALAALGLCGAAASDAPPLRALNWLAPGADPAVLAVTPGECLRRPAEPQAALSVEVGRAAFRTPVLLGGQAARAGLSCEACHRSGRDNRDFLFPGISGAPGTADVTASLFSRRRGDGIDDPRPIPDLSAGKGQLKVDQAPQGRALEGFVHGLVTEEFDGAAPPAAVLAGLAAYVRALDPAACPAAEAQPVSLSLYMSDARRAAAAAEALARRGDAPGALMMVAAARARLGLIDERYAGRALAADRARLRAADAALARLARDLRGGRPRAAAGLARWRREAVALEAALRPGEPASLFAPQRLRAAAGARLPSAAPSL